MTQSFKYHLHPFVKLGFFVGINILTFSPIIYSYRWIILAVEIMLAFICRLPWNLMRGFFKVLALNFIGLYLIFYFATFDWLAALLEFGNFGLTLIVMILAAFIFTFSTPPMELVSQFRRLRIPAKLVFAVVIAISWLPLLTKEIQNIVIIQKSRGYKIRLFNLGPIIIPAILRFMDLAINLSISLESRGLS